ncbi:hypothetical protein EMIT0P265_20058 [Pseudomonas zeae]
MSENNHLKITVIFSPLIVVGELLNAVVLNASVLTGRIYF